MQNLDRLLIFRALVLVLSFISPQIWAQLSIPHKHELDQRTYRRFTMDNQLKVLLVHDPDLNQSSVAMDVAVGSLSDPKHTQGLAHFLEHMLFLGTKKYPEEGEFGKFLRSRAGYFNAYTAGHHTNYHFQIHHDAFEGAIDRFSQFFISPLFSPEFSIREIQAVHNEHKKNILDDGWRQHHLLNTFLTPNTLLDTLAQATKKRSSTSNLLFSGPFTSSTTAPTIWPL